MGHLLRFARPLASAAQNCTMAGESASCISLQGVRGVLRLAGDPVFHFLQGLVTNNLAGIEAAQKGCVYACLLNAQGRHLHDMFIHRVSGDQPAVLLDVDASGLPDLVKLLRRYRLRQKIDITDVSDTYSVWVHPSLHVVSTAEREAAPGYGSDVASTSSRGLSTLYAWQRDPRLGALGARCIGPWAEGQVRAQERYTLQRYSLGVPEGDEEIPQGQAMPLEYNLDVLNGVAYDKGCYIGQELVARTHYKGVIRKRLMPVQIASTGVHEEEGPSFLPEVGARVTLSGAPEAGSKGALRAICQQKGLALLRLDAALPTAAGEGPGLSIESDQKAATWTVKPSVPEWWPAEWAVRA